MLVRIILVKSCWFSCPLARWDEEFIQQHRTLEDAVGRTSDNPVQVYGDELSKTAGLLVESLKDEANPKFQKSAFMGFMRQLRDKEMVVDGDQIVPSSEATTATTSSSTVHHTVTNPTTFATSQIRDRAMSLEDWPMKSVHFDPTITTTTERDQASSVEEMSEEDAYWQAENRDYRDYWDKAATIPLQTAITAMKTAQQREWGQLQESWDAWEATATGVKQNSTGHYPFQMNNPYTFDSLSKETQLTSGQGMDQVRLTGLPFLQS
jgi:peroxin-5